MNKKSLCENFISQQLSYFGNEKNNDLRFFDLLFYQNIKSTHKGT